MNFFHNFWKDVQEGLDKHKLDLSTSRTQQNLDIMYFIMRN